jgi:isopenicillin N synthase-like dioxygenase
MHVLNVDYTSPQAQALFCQSLKETGFGVLTNHPISPPLIEQAYQQWRDFFNTDITYRNTFRHQKPRQDGYFPFKTENAKDSRISDLKEFFHLYPWGQVPAEMKAISETMYHALIKLAVELLQWVEHSLPADIAQRLSMPLSTMIQESPNTLLRILHYPPLSTTIEPGAVRAAAHEDINLITLLPAATAPGLEVLDVHGNWHAVSCDPGSVVVNVGDMLQMATGQYFKSTTHRVVNPEHANENESRYSMPLFLHARGEVKIAEAFTATEYLAERLRQIGIY